MSRFAALGVANVDTVSDFIVSVDKIRLDSAIFAALSPGGLSALDFVTGAAAGDASDRILYDGGTGALYFDADGSDAGAQIQFATLSTGLALTSDDFIIA